MPTEATVSPHRPYSRWLLAPLHEPGVGYESYMESASFDFILETLATHAEIADVSRARSPGTVATKNALWRDLHSCLARALSNVPAAPSVPNRSAAVLHFYAALNFATAELLDTHAAALVNKRIGHGSSSVPRRRRESRETDGES